MADIDEDFGNDEWPFGDKGEPNDVLVPLGPSYIQIISSGLFVDNLGSIVTPLHQEQAGKIISHCEKFPFGHSMDTKMDETVQKSWQLDPSLDQFKNPHWQSGFEKLSKIVADRLGYEGTPLQCKLYKLLVYGEGGHFLKHQGTEKEDGMIATLIVQPPSAHEGGDLLVYRGGEVKYRHDFGKADGTSPYYSHYAVHYADAEHSLEEVTKGYQLVLVHCICPPPTMCHLEKKLDKPFSEDLASAVANLEGDHDSFALLLAPEYTEKSIHNLGWKALKGVDCARFRALDGANYLLDTDKQLKLFIAKLAHDVIYMDDGCQCKLEDHKG